MRQFILVVVVLFTSSCDNNVDHFPVLDEQQISSELERLGLESCNAFRNTYLNTPKTIKEKAFAAFAYDRGLCTNQNLIKAASIYEELLETQHRYNFGLAQSRLFFLYNYGPRMIRDYDQAKFMAMQVAIFLSAARTDEDEENFAQMLFLDKTVPSEISRKLQYIRSLQERPLNEKKEVVSRLEKEGFIVPHIVLLSE